MEAWSKADGNRVRRQKASPLDQSLPWLRSDRDANRLPLNETSDQGSSRLAMAGVRVGAGLVRGFPAKERSPQREESAAYLRLLRGTSSIRFFHNPPSPARLLVCQSLKTDYNRAVGIVVRWLLLWTCLLAVTMARAAAGAVLSSQDSSWFARAWQSDDGLPENHVTGVTQTPDGYLWIGTHAGLARFDGVKFRNIPLPTAQGVRQRLIRAMLLDRQQRLWLALEGAVVMTLSPTATNVFTAADGVHYGRPLVVTQDGEGAIWIGYAHGVAFRIVNGKVTRFDANDGLPGTGGCWLATDNEGKLWFASGRVLGQFREGRFVSRLTLDSPEARITAARAGGLWVSAEGHLARYVEGQSPTPVRNLAVTGAGVVTAGVFEDRSGAVWVGTQANGLFRYDGTNFEPVETSQAEILSMHEDREGNFWVGTGGGGLNRLRPRVLELQRQESGLPLEVVRSICEDTGGRLWATLHNGALVWRERDRWQVVTTNQGWPGDSATCVTAGQAGEVWIGTDHGRLYRYAGGKFSVLNRQDGLAGDLVRSLFMDREGGLWLGLEFPNCVQRFKDGQWRNYSLHIASQPVRTMAQDARGNVWLGTGDGGLLRWEEPALVEETAHTLPVPHAVQALCATPDGSLWIGYAGVGLGRLKAGRFARLGVEHGLHDEFISKVLADEQGWLWFASNRGIFKVRREELDAVAEGRATTVHSISYGRDEALRNLQANYGFGPGAVRSQDGRLWFPMLTGLAVVRPDRIPAERPPPPVIIERVLMDGQELTVPPGEESTAGKGATAVLRLPPGHRKLDFEFTALGFLAPENVRFRHRLEGLDESWVESGTDRSISYSRLPAGDYRFRVAACNNVGVWNEEDMALVFAVAPFYWQTWWFRVGVGGSVLAIFGGSIRSFEKRKIRRRMEALERQHAVERERMRIARDLHDEMGANLTQIALLSELAQSDLARPELAKHHIDEVFRTAQSLTRSLDGIVWAVNPANDTLEQFVAHLCTFAPTFLQSAGVSCRLDVPDELPAMPLPAGVRHHLHLSTKELLHNIAKHAQATEVWLRLKLTPDTLTLVLEDNGRGFQPPAATAPGADGLGNLRHRMGEIGGSVEQQSQAGRGTVTTLIAPLQPDDA